ncbi:peptide ABC transporter substrate-binding protein [Sphingorhabdus sp. YGSMI21]|uniref:peptide ABC transporter substrate-binding protein n=1 Tax=Sphingorhabdus sp. YGSMI21 TaxID=2077182 RepID=UPI000C1F227E|nr:peptide ABC transporter substrate-binding protein [Sphingorhabdus sp. YGSMI21]ATW03944.1 4-phytase [Sphingorhabdus sp. YGSMI21]
MRYIALLCTCLLLISCDSRPVADTAPGPAQIVRLSDSEIKGLDPQKISDLSSLRVAADQFEGLTRLDAGGAAEPGLAKSWQIAADGLTWAFTLRDNLRFSDGTAFDASLFPALLRRLRASETAAPAQALFGNILAIEAPDGNLVIVSLAAPDPALPALLAHPAMAALPLHRIKEAGDQWTADRPMVASGPYQLSEWKLNDHARLERNPAWHDEAAPTATIIWKPMDDSLSAMRLFLSGGADIAADYPASRHQWLKEHHPAAAHSVPYLGSYYFAFNTRAPPFDDRRVRTALSMAVERQWIAEKVIGIGNIPAWGLLPPGLVGAQAARPEWADWPREKRLREARALLEAAGFDAGHPLRFEIRFNSSTEHRRVAVAMAAMWQPLGVEASLFNSEAALHFAALRRHEFSLARSGWIADLPTPENFLQVHQQANGAGNYSGYDNPDYDRLLVLAFAEPDPARRRTLTQQAEAILITDMPVLPLYFYVTRSLVAERIAGWKDNISNVHPSRTLRIRP